MSIAQSLLPEFDHEMANTRKALERVPDNRLEYRPDPKSMTLGRLAGHLAEMPIWASMTLQKDELDIAGQYQAMTAASRQQALDAFDKNAKAAREAIAGASDEHLMKNWSLKAGSQVLFTMPRIAVLRSMVMNHMIHHRGQLTVYFRLNGVPVPGMYGPSADEGQMPAAASR